MVPVLQLHRDGIIPHASFASTSTLVIRFLNFCQHAKYVKASHVFIEQLPYDVKHSFRLFTSHTDFFCFEVVVQVFCHFSIGLPVSLKLLCSSLLSGYHSTSGLSK